MIGCSKKAEEPSVVQEEAQPGWYTSSTVSAEGENNYDQRITAKPGDVLDFKIEYTNTGNTWQTAVTVHEDLSNGLEPIAGSVYVSNETAENQKVSDSLFAENGINIGDYGAGQSATITYKAKIVEDWEPGADDENVIYNNVWLVTENGTQYDKVKITVER